jgi:hypothetical protein
MNVVAEGMVHTALRDVLRWCGGAGNEGGGDRGGVGGKERELFDTLFVFQHEETLDEGGREEEQRKLWRALPGEAVADVSIF